MAAVTWANGIMPGTSPQHGQQPAPDGLTRLNDYYSILGVDPSATVDDIRRAFRQLARKYHPDVNPDPDAEERFHEINTAYQVLMDTALRAEYDTARAGGTPPQPRSRPGSQQDVRRFYFQRRVRAATDPRATWNYYDVLGVQGNAPEETVVRAYQRLYREFYHGRQHDPGTDAILQEIEEAREVLLDPERRHAYDQLPPDRQPPGRPGMGKPTANRQSGPATQHGKKSGCLLFAGMIPLVALFAVLRRFLPG